MIAAVFGSSRPQPGDPLYARAQRTGYLLAEHGYTVMTGGYNGVMEAASRGAKEANGTTIGVTVSLFEKIGARSGPNSYVDEVVTYDTLSERVLHLCTHGDVIVALDGGIGTLADIALTWSLMHSEEVAPRAVVVLWER
ncbi:MAG: LOG family protein, partial [Chloroflexi bacterium]|nr:LOG family protein [Chloroflexota bacterium]